MVPSSLSLSDRAKIILPYYTVVAQGGLETFSIGYEQHSRNLNSDLSFGLWNAGIPCISVSALFFLVVLDGIWVFIKISV